MALRDTYNAAIMAAKGHMEGSADERDGKLFFHGSVKTEEEKNAIWNAIKTVPSWQNDIVADIKVVGGAPAPAFESYTVKAGDTLSKIAREKLGDSTQFMKIFEANGDLLTNPDKIVPGQVLKIPALAAHK